MAPAPPAVSHARMLRSSATLQRTRIAYKTPKRDGLTERRGRRGAEKRRTYPLGKRELGAQLPRGLARFQRTRTEEHRSDSWYVEPARVLLQPQAETIMKIMSVRVLAPASRRSSGASNRELRLREYGFVRSVFVACVALLVSISSTAFAQDDDGAWITPAPAAPADAAAAEGAAAADSAAAADGTEDGDWSDDEMSADDLGEEYTDQGAAPAADEYADTDPAALNDFRPYLDPHGQWVYDPVYGQVWIPNRAEVGQDFAPYVTNGYWGEDENGDWIWVSGYDFGWVVFHYGRWVWVPDVGWAWIPGRRYAPAWVVWRVPSDDYAYIGWAPMPPSWGWHGGVAVSLWVYPPYPYVFCPTAYVYHHHVHTYIVHDHARVRHAARHTHRYHPRRHGHRGRHAAARPRRGPSPSESHVPAKGRPKSRTPADPRAVQASKRSTSSKVRKPAYRAKALPGASADNRRKAIQKGGRPLTARNFESAPRPRVSAKGPSRRPAAASARSRSPRARSLGTTPGASGRRAAPRAPSKATPRSSSRYRPSRAPRRAPSAKRPTRGYRPAPSPAYRPKAKSSRSSGARRSGSSYRPTPKSRRSSGARRASPSYRPSAKPSRSTRSYRPSKRSSGSSSSDYKKKKKSSRSSYTPRRSSAPRSHVRRSRSSSPAPRRSAPRRRR